MKNKTRNIYSDQECNDCGEYILKARIILLPYTETCIACQEGREKKGIFKKHKMRVNYTYRCGEIEATEETLIRSGV